MNMNSEVESELNQILMAAIQSDIAQKAVEPAAPPTEKVDEIPRCSICCSQKPRYRCPACNMRTCSMECVKQHKIEENCSGKRDPTKKVDKKEMGDRMLLSDYRFLEDANRQIYGIQRNYEVNFKPYPKSNRNNVLHQQSMARGFVLWTLPDGMSKKNENTTVISTVKGLVGKHNKPLKLFHFHIKWTIDLSSGKQVVLNTKIIESWNLGKLVEKVVKSIETDEFSRQDIKAECLEESEAASVDNDEDSSGHVSGGSVSVAETPSYNAEHAELCKPIESGKEKFVFNVFMKRITGLESYYQFLPEKSLRENLEGKAIVEYPELIIAAPSQWPYYHSRLTDIVDYKKGKRPQRPDQVPRDTAGEAKNDPKKWNTVKVNMKDVELEKWQKEALTGGNKRKKKKVVKKTSEVPQSETKKLNGPEREERTISSSHFTKEKPTGEEAPVKKPCLSEAEKPKFNTLKFFDTSQISSDSE